MDRLKRTWMTKILGLHFYSSIIHVNADTSYMYYLVFIFVDSLVHFLSLFLVFLSYIYQNPIYSSTQLDILMLVWGQKLNFSLGRILDGRLIIIRDVT